MKQFSSSPSQSLIVPFSIKCLGDGRAYNKSLIRHPTLNLLYVCRHDKDIDDGDPGVLEGWLGEAWGRL